MKRVLLWTEDAHIIRAVGARKGSGNRWDPKAALSPPIVREPAARTETE